MRDRTRFVHEYLRDFSQVVESMPPGDIVRLLEVLEAALQDRRLVLLAGNGGSSATASHMANDLMNGVAQGGGPGFRAVALASNVPAITSIANDEDYSEIFARQIERLGERGDLLLVISGSGNSLNLVRAVEAAKSIGMTTLALLGMGGGKLASMVDLSVITPSDQYGPVEDCHMVLDHLITAYFRNSFDADSQR